MHLDFTIEQSVGTIIAQPEVRWAHGIVSIARKT